MVGGPQYRVGSHRQFTLMARAFAAAGYPVLRFDYRGIGDSEGESRGFERNEIIKNPQTAARYAGKSYPMALEMVVHLGKGIHPVHWAPFIKQPVLVIAMEHDGQIPLDAVKQFHAGLAGEKKLHLFSTGNHYSVYDEMLDDTFKITREWLDAQLKV